MMSSSRLAMRSSIYSHVDSLITMLGPYSLLRPPPSVRRSLPQQRRLCPELIVVGQQHLSRHGHPAAVDQPHVGDGVVRGTEGARGHQGGVAAGTAGEMAPTSPTNYKCSRLRAANNW
jgi:hypothetical protein